MRPRVKVFFDGGCRPAGMETAVVVNGRSHIRRDLGPGSSMQAEWLALIHAAEIARDLGLAEPVLLGDAQAVIHQANGVVKCREPFRHYLRALERISSNPRIRYVKRAQNLAGIALARLHPR